VQNYRLTLKAEASSSFHAIKARNSVDIQDDSKLVHEMNISGVDLETLYNVGLIIGASGSGKTTLAKHIFKEHFHEITLDKSKAIIDQFPESYSYDDRAMALTAIGLSQVPCWIKPLGVLSNGQQERAKIAVALACAGENISVFDEWTSVVDRNVAAVMSHSAQKMLRKTGKRAVFLSCHYDIIEWLDPDWIIDCNQQKYINLRDMVGGERKKKYLFQSMKSATILGSSLANIII